MGRTDRIANGAAGALVAALSGVVAMVTIVVFFVVGQPFGTLNDTALLVMTAALLPVMLAHDELAGRPRSAAARAWLAIGSLAIGGWIAVQAAFIVGLVDFDYTRGATGAFALSAALQVVIGLWIVGASLAAGGWLPSVTRILGIVAGAGTVLLSLGLLLGGIDHPLTSLGGIGYQVVLPIWAVLLWRVFRTLSGTAPVQPASAGS